MVEQPKGLMIQLQEMGGRMVSLPVVLGSNLDPSFILNTFCF